MPEGGPRRAVPVAVGPHSHRIKRVDRTRQRRARQRRRRRVAGGFVVAVLVAVVVAAVFVGSKLLATWNSGNDYTGVGKRDIVIRIRAGDSTTAVGASLPPSVHSLRPLTVTPRFRRSSPAITGPEPRSRRPRRSPNWWIRKTGWGSW